MLEVAAALFGLLYVIAAAMMVLGLSELSANPSATAFFAAIVLIPGVLVALSGLMWRSNRGDRAAALPLLVSAAVGIGVCALFRVGAG